MDRHERSKLTWSVRGRLVRASIIVVGGWLMSPGHAWAHDGRPPAPHDLWAAWTVEVPLLVGLAVAGGVYLGGLGRLWRRAGGQGIPVWRASAYGLGWLALAVALVSPLHALGTALFSSHMVQHMVLVVVAAPLLALGLPAVTSLWALPSRWRLAIAHRWRVAGRARALPALAGSPLVAWGLATGVFWLWHVPGLYQAALRSEVVHIVEHVSLLATALVAWWTVVRPAGRGRPVYGLRVLSLFAAALVGGLFGALVTFARRPWYPAYGASVPDWGLTPLTDQQLAGVAMWGPASLAYAAAALLVLARWLHPTTGR
jgi:putative membrane protein